MQGRTIRFLIKVVGSLSLLIGLAIFFAVGSAYVFGWNRISEWNWSAVIIHSLLIFQIAWGILFLYLAWLAWFGPIEKAVEGFSVVCAFATFFIVERLAIWICHSKELEEWLRPGKLGGWGPFLGLFISFLLLVGPFYLAFTVHRTIKSQLLQRV